MKKRIIEIEGRSGSYYEFYLGKAKKPFAITMGEVNHGQYSFLGRFPEDDRHVNEFCQGLGKMKQLIASILGGEIKFVRRGKK